MNMLVFLHLKVLDISSLLMYWYPAPSHTNICHKPLPRVQEGQVFKSAVYITYYILDTC